jgi:hypothetical protein
MRTVLVPPFDPQQAHSRPLVPLNSQSTKMKPNTLALRTILALSALSASTLTWAHEGHGMPGVSHWHDTDVWAFVALAALAGAAWNWFKGGK